MAEYIRRKRYVKYGDKKCKHYLRVDFNRSCAYCKINEAEMIQGLRFFQIDHFMPKRKFSDRSDIHHYFNLYYSCEICNGASGKSDNWNEGLLNPCSETIFGKSPADSHILDMHDAEYKLIPLTNKGQEYIDTLKLNQKDHRKIRKIRLNYQKKIIERKELSIQLLKKLDDLRDLPKLPEIRTEKARLEKNISELDKEILGAYYFEQDIECWFDFEQEQRFIKKIEEYFIVEKVYAEYDFDYEFCVNPLSPKQKCILKVEENIIFNNKVKQVRIPIEQAIDWKEQASYHGIYIFLFDKITDNLYYCSLNKRLLDTDFSSEQKQFTISIYEGNHVSNENMKAFIQNIS